MPGQQAQFQTKLEWALYWAHLGFYVFPCSPGQKKPLISNNLRLATRDHNTIIAWWTSNPEANVGCVPGKSGHFVLDVDVKGDGYASLERLEEKQGVLPATFTISTPSGGAHFWYCGQAATTARKFGSGLDTRGVDGYVLLPGSVLDDGCCYRIADDATPEPAPSWLLELLKPVEHEAAPGTAEEDTPINVARAVAFLEQAEIAVEGEGGDHLTFQTIAWVRDFGISQEKALELLAPWNDRCEPPWGLDELAQKVENAYSYAQNEAGAKAEPQPSETYKNIKLEPSEKGTVSEIRYKLRTMKEARERPEPEWIVPSRWPRDSLCFVYGPGDSYKSFNVLNDVLEMAYAGERVIYIAGEGAHGIDKKRIPAWQLAKFRGEDAPFMTLDNMPPARQADELKRFCLDVKAQNFEPTVIVIDTLARFLAGLNENDAKDAGIAIAALDGIRASFPGCALIVIHHSGKETERGMRGSSALHAGADVVYRVGADRNTLIVRIDCEKMKDAETPDPLYREGKIVGASLVFCDIDAGAYKAATADEGHSWKAAARSLARMGRTVSTETLAADILSDLAEELSEEETDKRRRALVRSLKQRAQDALSAFVVGGTNARHLVWGFQAPT